MNELDLERKILNICKYIFHISTPVDLNNIQVNALRTKTCLAKRRPNTVKNPEGNFLKKSS